MSEAPETPAACPFCHSPNVKTTSKVVDVSTYWRCLACGEIWNPSRLPQNQWGGGKRW